MLSLSTAVQTDISDVQYCAQKYAVAAYIIPDPDPNMDPDLCPPIDHKSRQSKK